MEHPVTTHSDMPPLAESSRRLTLRGVIVLGIGSKNGFAGFRMEKRPLGKAPVNDQVAVLATTGGEAQ